MFVVSKISSRNERVVVSEAVRFFQVIREENSSMELLCGHLTRAYINKLRLSFTQKFHRFFPSGFGEHGLHPG